jgi:hypothetical protein
VKSESASVSLKIINALGTLENIEVLEGMDRRFTDVRFAVPVRLGTGKSKKIVTFDQKLLVLNSHLKEIGFLYKKDITGLDIGCENPLSALQ